jgi:hypothetical protein
MNDNQQFASKAISDFIHCLEQLDCGDNSCHFVKERKGMRTNGGCRCLSFIKEFDKRHAVQNLYYLYKRKDIQ